MPKVFEPNSSTLVMEGIAYFFLFFSLGQLALGCTWLHLASLGFWRLASGFWAFGLLAFGFWLWLHLALGFWLHLALQHPKETGFWLFFGFWFLGFLASGFWLLAFASLRMLHLVCWSFGFLPSACARGMKTLLISVRDR